MCPHKQDPDTVHVIHAVTFLWPPNVFFCEVYRLLKCDVPKGTPYRRIKINFMCWQLLFKHVIRPNIEKCQSQMARGGVFYRSPTGRFLHWTNRWLPNWGDTKTRSTHLPSVCILYRSVSDINKNKCAPKPHPDRAPSGDPATSRPDDTLPSRSIRTWVQCKPNLSWASLCMLTFPSEFHSEFHWSHFIHAIRWLDRDSGSVKCTDKDQGNFN